MTIYVDKICQKHNINYCSYVFTVLVFSSFEFKKSVQSTKTLHRTKKSYVSVWNWIQRFESDQIYQRKRGSEFIIDGTIIQISGSHFHCRFV
ncbi:MAG: hypothetical protein MRJ93_12215 [Nitrososphaeraceae archaeon]|nr:hypothetical protein [Nitrososphaeraceae archaeon]